MIYLVSICSSAQPCTSRRTTSNNASTPSCVCASDPDQFIKGSPSRCRCELLGGTVISKDVECAFRALPSCLFAPTALYQNVLCTGMCLCSSLLKWYTTNSRPGTTHSSILSCLCKRQDAKSLPLLVVPV